MKNNFRKLLQKQGYCNRICLYMIGKFLRQISSNYKYFAKYGLSVGSLKKRFDLTKSNIHHSRYMLYDHDWLRKLRINTVIDIGANVGEFTWIFSKLFSGAEIFAFEPLPNCYRQLQERTKNRNNIHCYNVGLGNEDGSMEIHESDWHPASSFREMDSLHKMNYPHSSGSKDLTVNIKRLDDVLEGEKLVDNIFIKMDVQGFEDEVIKGGNKIFSKAKVIIVEVSFEQLYKGEPLFHGLYSLLEPLGFKFAGNLKQSVNKKDGRFLQADCIFIK